MKYNEFMFNKGEIEMNGCTCKNDNPPLTLIINQTENGFTIQKTNYEHGSTHATIWVAEDVESLKDWVEAIIETRGKNK